MEAMRLRRALLRSRKFNGMLSLGLRLMGRLGSRRGSGVDSLLRTRLRESGILMLGDLVFLWILNVIGLRGCIIADFFFRGKRVVGVNVRPCRGCCLVCGVVGRTPCQLVFQAGKCWWLSGQ